MKKRTQEQKYGPRKTGELSEGDMKTIRAYLRRGRIKDGATIAGAATLGGMVAFTLEDTLRDLGEMVGETIDSTRFVARALIPEDKSPTEMVATYLERIPPDVRESYIQHTSESYFEKIGRLFDRDDKAVAHSKAGEVAEKFPGAQSEPVKDVRGLKGWILTKTKEILTGADEPRKEEIEATNTPEYQEHYNLLANTKGAGIDRLTKIRRGIEKFCEKVELAEMKTGKVDTKTTEILEGMVREYNGVAELLGSIDHLPVMDVKRGLESQEYAAVIKTADDYGIKPADYTGWGDGIFYGAIAVAALAGGVISRLGGGIADTLYAGTKTGAKALGYIGKKAGQAARGIYHLGKKHKGDEKSDGSDNSE